MLERLRVGAIEANCWLIPLESGTDGESGSCIVVDPGAEPARIIDVLDARKLRPELLVCTHGHLDHVAALGPLKAAYRARGRDVPIAIHRADQNYLGAKAKEYHRALFTAIGARSFFESLWVPLPDADVLLDDGATLIGSAWRVIHTPGHSAGSLCLLDEERGFLVSGDTLFRDGVGRTDGPDSDEAALRESITERLFSLPAGTRVFPGHGEPTTIGRESGAASQY